jgi:hypothetical protein
MLGNGPSFGGGAGILFTIVPIFIGIVFIVVIGSLIFRGVRYAQNASAPRESVHARVVAKRMDVRNNARHHEGHSSRTYYYITLEFDNGTRKEFLDVKNLFGLVVEGDAGYAATKGDWIVDFEREGAYIPKQS